MSLRARSIVIGLIAMFMIFLCIPSFIPAKIRESSALIPDQAISLGLDLQGGIYWLMRIDREDAISQRVEQASVTLQEIATEEGLSIGTPEILESERALRLCGGNPGVLEGVLEDRFPRWQLEPDTEGCQKLSLTEGAIDEIITVGVDQSVEVLQERLSEGGFVEPIIAKQGQDRILVQMPGSDFEDRERAKQLIAEPTVLEFKKVLDAAGNEGLLQAKYPDGLPADTEIVIEKQEDVVIEALLVTKIPLLIGANLQDARVQYDRTNRPAVGFEWDGEGTKKFRDFTTENIGQRMAIIKDDNVISAPVIESRIGQSGQITGSFSPEEARTLAIQLRAGALPVRLLIEEERTIGPSLGADSISSGLGATLAGSAVVIVFMMIYYQTSGFLANIALLLNLAIIFAIMSSFRATLTLPGIAGLVLTVGMAVDANVIIFERIREEIRAGRPTRAAVHIGFDRSRLAILDANITTLIAGIVLYYLGHGPVQGFAVTLVIGIFSSVFCALVVSRLLFDLMLSRTDALKI